MTDAERQEALGSADNAHARTPQATDTGSVAPTPAPNFFGRVQDKLQSWRKAALEHTPGFIINNATNIMGVLHIFAEGLMLKSAGITFMKNHRGGTQPNMLIDPVNNVCRSVMRKDLHDERGRLFQNPWQARSTGIGMTTWAVSSVTPEANDNEERIDDAIREQKEHPLKYYAKHAGEGFLWFSPKYKRQQIGLGVTAAGLCSVISGFHGVDLMRGKNYSNLLHSLGGLITMIAGSQLWFSPTREQAWQRYGATMWARLPIIPFNVAVKYQHHDRWGYYTAGNVLFELVDAFAFFLGGAQKLPDGQLVDAKAMRDAARARYTAPHAERQAQTHVAILGPTSTVSARHAEGALSMATPTEEVRR